MRSLLKPALLPLLRRNPGEVVEVARAFRIERPGGRELVAGVGGAFLGGYNAMLAARAARDIGAVGASVEAHFRPFFFEGAAMGYLPRGYFAADGGPATAERTLLAIDPRFLYLYYVGFGFWHGFRHAKRPAALESLSSHLDARYFPLCYDGFGFKLGFFDFASRPECRAVLEQAPATRRATIYQGFGRALFFVFMDDEDGFQRARCDAPETRRADMETGRSLALAFTGIREPARILAHAAGAGDEGDRAARLLGITWALTAREMNDPAYFGACLAALPAAECLWLTRLPALCREALAETHQYEDWQRRTMAKVVSSYANRRQQASG